MRNRARLRKISRNSAKRKQKTARYAAEPVKIDLIRVSLMSRKTYAAPENVFNDFDDLTA